MTSIHAYIVFDAIAWDDMVTIQLDYMMQPDPLTSPWADDIVWC